uniref:uncharacterized protein LOC122589362 n=1 Tax=Erigeron canadensis TaxID=72917 RepID=UPI001CB989F2|nr:uncharacterized protein LOC122589362 [Erigeron canadensis]
MDDECSPFNWDCYYQEEGQGMEELKHTLLYTLELETTIACVHEEITRKRDEVSHFKCLLSKTIKERDEAHMKCQGLVMENIILQQKIQELEAHSSSFVRTTPNCYLEDDPNLGVDSSSGSDESFAGTQGIERVPLSLQPPTQKPQTIVVDDIILKKGLPENGKFLQAVVEAGPLLQTLLLAGPLPQWQHPPPQLNSIEIPPVTIPSNSTTTPRILLHQDSCVSTIISGGSKNSGGGGLVTTKKRGLEEKYEEIDYDSYTNTNTKNQKVVHQSSLTNM